MRRYLAIALLTVTGCGWQAAGSPNPSVRTSTIYVSVGQTSVVTLPALPPNESRSATSSSMTVASAKIDSSGELEITGVSSGTATVTQTDSSGASVIMTRTYDVIVTP